MSVITIETFAQSSNDYIKLGKEATKYIDRITFFSKAIRADTTSGIGYFFRGSEYYINKNYVKSIRDLSNALKYKYDDLSSIYWMRFMSFMQTYKYDSAIDDINKSIEIRQNDKSYYRFRGIINLSLERYNDAINDFQIWIDDCISMKAGPPYELIGWVYLAKNEFVESINYFNKGDFMHPSPNPCEVGLVISYFQLNEKSKARIMLQKIIKDDQSLKSGKDIVNGMVNNQEVFVIGYTNIINTIYKELISDNTHN